MTNIASAFVLYCTSARARRYKFGREQISENPILDWFKSDDSLCDIVNQITATGKRVEEQALDAFHQVSNHYDLPRYPENFSDKYYERFEQMDVDDPRSVFEEATICRYLDPEDDPRGIVMVALYNVKHGRFIDLNECAKKHFGSIPKEYMVCYIGEGFAGELHFLNPGESWLDLPGSKSASKVINP